MGTLAVQSPQVNTNLVENRGPLFWGDAKQNHNNTMRGKLSSILGVSDVLRAGGVAC